MTCRECGDEVRELYSCRICEGAGLCMECAVLCEEDLPFTVINPHDGEEWPEEKGDDQCLTIFEQVEQAQLVKPRGKCVKETAHDGVVWNL